MPCAWALMNSRQVGPILLGAGPNPSSNRMARIVEPATKIPSFFSSPRIRRYPHRRFSLATAKERPANHNWQSAKLRLARTYF